MMCNKCKSNNIRVRKNFTHGRNSKPKISLSCRDCGSTDVSKNDRRSRRRR